MLGQDACSCQCSPSLSNPVLSPHWYNRELLPRFLPSLGVGALYTLPPKQSCATFAPGSESRQKAGCFQMNPSLPVHTDKLLLRVLISSATEQPRAFYTEPL